MTEVQPEIAIMYFSISDFNLYSEKVAFQNDEKFSLAKQMFLRPRGPTLPLSNAFIFFLSTRPQAGLRGNLEN